MLETNPNRIDAFVKKIELLRNLTNFAHWLLLDSIIWPDYRSQYYLGLVSCIHNYPSGDIQSTTGREELWAKSYTRRW
jgi:hypothetical protein